MGHFDRLQLVGRVTYYFGWITLICGGLAHLNIARSLFDALSVNKRNLLELSVVWFLICMASELRALTQSKGEMSSEAPGVVKRQAAA